MTGRDLIFYILQNGLENKQISLSEGFFNMLSEEQLAMKFEVGVSTVRVWYNLGMIEGVKIGNKTYFLPTVVAPVKCSYSDGSTRWISTK